MGRFLGGIFGNDTPFGQLMTRCFILVAANLLFVLCSLPVVTAGPAFVALYYVMLKVLRGDRELNPAKAFFHGFKTNFKQAILVWIALLAIGALAYVDYRFLRSMGDAGQILKYAVGAVALAVLAVAVCLAPVMAAFADTIPHLIRNAVFFASKNPLRLIALVALYVVPFAVTYLDEHLQPLYAFCWFFFGFSAIVMASSSLLIKDFNKYLPKRGWEEEEEHEVPSEEAREEEQWLY